MVTIIFKWRLIRNHSEMVCGPEKLIRNGFGEAIN